MIMKMGDTHSNKTKKKLSKAMRKVVKTQKYRNTVYQLQRKNKVYKYFKSKETI